MSAKQPNITSGNGSGDFAEVEESSSCKGSLVFLSSWSDPSSSAWFDSSEDGLDNSQLALLLHWELSTLGSGESLMVDSSAELRKEWLGGFLSLEKGEGGFAGGIGGAAGWMAVKDSIDGLCWLARSLTLSARSMSMSAMSAVATEGSSFS